MLEAVSIETSALAFTKPNARASNEGAHKPSVNKDNLWRFYCKNLRHTEVTY